MSADTLRTLSAALAADPDWRRVVLVCCAVTEATVEPVTGSRRARYDEALHELRAWARTGRHGEVDAAIERADVSGPWPREHHVIVTMLRAVARLVGEQPGQIVRDRVHDVLGGAWALLGKRGRPPDERYDYDGALARIAEIVRDYDRARDTLTT